MDMLAQNKRLALAGVERMAKNKPPANLSLSVELAILREKIEALPLTVEKFNPEDRPYQLYFQQEIGWKISLLSKFEGISKAFYYAIWDAYRYPLSLIKNIEADDQLLEIGKLIEIICDRVITAVLPQNKGSFYADYYQIRLSEQKEEH